MEDFESITTLVNKDSMKSDNGGFTQIFQKLAKGK